LITIRTEWLETFVLFNLWMYYTWHSSSFHIRSFSYLVRIMSVKTCTTSKLLHASHGIRTSAYGHGGIDIQSLHDSWHLCVTQLSHPFLQPLQKLSRSAPVTLLITWKWRYTIIKQVNSLFGFYMPVKHYIFTI